MVLHRALALGGAFAAALAFSAAARADDADGAASPVSATNWRTSAGLTFSSGDYGGQATTRIASAPLSLRYTRDRLSVRLSVPFVRVTGPGTLLDSPQSSDGGGGAIGDDGGASGSEAGDAAGEIGDDTCPVTTPPASGESENDPCPPATAVTAAVVAGTIPRTRSGLGDASVTLGYGLDLGEVATLDLSARVKLPTASRARGLGTGKVDVTLGGTLGHAFGPASIWVGARRKLVGKSPTLGLRDTWGAGGGLSYKVAPSVTLGADYDWQQSATRRAPFSEVTGWASIGLSPRIRLQAYAGSGLSSRSANFLGGLSVSYRFGS